MKINTNISTLTLFQALQLLPVAAFIVVASTPQYALAFSQKSAIGAPFVVGSYIFLKEPAHSSQMLPAGTVLGVTVTAYSSTPDQTDADPYTTASGTHVRPGVAAANFLPIGTKVQIGSHVYTIEDRIGASRGYHIDVWTPSVEEARAFGVQTAQVKIIAIH